MSPPHDKINLQKTHSCWVVAEISRNQITTLIHGLSRDWGSFVALDFSGLYAINVYGGITYNGTSQIQSGI